MEGQGWALVSGEEGVGRAWAGRDLKVLGMGGGRWAGKVDSGREAESRESQLEAN